MIARLAPLFPGELSVLGENLVCSPRPPADAVAVDDLLHNPALLERLLRQRADHLGVRGDDVRAVASTWSLQYLWALLPPLAAAASVLQHVFPAAAADMALTLDTEGLPLRFYIAHEGESAQDADTLTRYDALLFQHLEPLFARISEQANLPRKILWGNAARYLEIVLEQALVATGGCAVVAGDKDTLLQQPHWSTGRRNPLHAHQRDVLLRNEGRCETIRLHRQCCLTHLLPAEHHCTACPLALQHQPGFA